MKKNIIDDGFNAELVETATFAGFLEIPTVKNATYVDLTKNLLPFDQLSKTDNFSEIVHFYIHDKRFKSLIVNIKDNVEKLRKFKAVISVDCSLYYDMPLVLQMTNVYLNHQIGHYLQTQGITVIPNVRWGDERSYTRILPDEPPFAFLGYEKHGIYAVGTYGCCQSREEKHHIREGLRSMIKELEPETILVYGPMPASVFDEFKSTGVHFVHYENWTKTKRGGAYGKR
ncbi:MAG: DUF4417 domain-containing protein [Treponema sp.]|uniref:DUF4417 domain-containing protein n=1 Tax=Treponema sp. TaxID=166 RepID=UPI00298DC65B|nr:DUF4417 domain-containing protein [Treponema sp.]MCQ2602186.1 DUF4417 domain-containing protein [Treponema sp.]